MKSPSATRAEDLASGRLDATEIEVLTWLLGAQRPAPVGVDPRALQRACEQALRCWQVLPVVWERLVELLPGAQDTVATRRLRDRLASVENLARVQHVLLGRYVDALEAHGIPYVLLKGTATRALAFPSVTKRCGVDLDLGIPRECIYEAERIALDQGFQKAEWSADTKRFLPGSPSRRARVEAQHYELGFLVRDQAIADLDPDTAAAIRRDLEHQDPWHESGDGLGCYVTLDLHHRLTVATSLDGSLASASVVEQDGLHLRVPGIPWVVLHVIEKLYLEGVATYRKGAHQYADLVRLVPLLDDVDARALVRLAASHQLTIPAYFVLRRLPSDFSLKLPAALAQMVEEHHEVPPAGVDAYAMNDLGDPWPKLWGQR